MNNPFEDINNRLDKLESVLNKIVSILMTPQEEKPTNPDEIMTKDEVAEMFGVSLVTLTAWQKKGLIPFIRKGGRVYFLRSSVITAKDEIQIKGR